MADNFDKYQQGLDSPAYNAATITPADSDLSTDLRAFYVGSAGDVAIETTGGDSVTFSNVPTGAIIPVRCRQLKSTGTTATSIVGLY